MSSRSCEYLGLGDEGSCERPVAPSSHDDQPYCIMHSRDPDKDTEAFLTEVEAILQREEEHDFEGFVFPPKVVFKATFTQDAYFIGATFTQDAKDANIFEARDAYFSGATFTQDADFSGATFTQAVDFRLATFTETVNFRRVHFADPARVRFVELNKGAPSGLRLLLRDTQIEGAQFIDVNWQRQRGRLMLEDETLARDSGEGHEQTAAIYRQLVNTFEGARAYDLAEEAAVGAMEMRRLNPENFPFGRSMRGRNWYRNSLLRGLGERFSLVNLYRGVSEYGTNYARAGRVLLLLLILFAAAYALPQSGFTGSAVVGWRSAIEVGVVHSLEIATFQRPRPRKHESVRPFVGFALETAQILLIPAQTAMFLFAVRRRFRK